MATALWPLQTAVYSTLTGRPQLMALVNGVFDDVPDNQAYPYVTIGDILETVADAHDHQGLDSVVTIHVWSDAAGFKEASRIFAEVDTALDRKSLSLAGFTQVDIWHDQHQEVRDPDPKIRHINAQYRVRMTRAS